MITRVGSGSAASKAGLKVNDQVVAVNGQPVSSGADFGRVIFSADRDVRLTIRRDGEEQPLELPVELDGKPLRLGVSWREDSAEPGVVLLTRVIPHSPAARAGLRVADRIMAINGERFTDGKALLEQVARSPRSLKLTVERWGQIRDVELEPAPSDSTDKS